MGEALFYKPLKNNFVQCRLCPNFCVLKNQEIGKCRVRQNIEGKLFSLSYGKPVSINIDPIAKKPLYHFLPNTFTFSVGMPGCNLSCAWCQNWDLTQRDISEFEIKEVLPEKIIEEALNSGCPSISYTYSEPFISYEYVLEIAKLAKKVGLKNILVTNGYVNLEPFKKISGFIDAMNIDLKTFDEKTYKRFCGGKLKPILDTIKLAYKKKIHLELTTLIIPGVNDSEKELKKIAEFIFNVDKKGEIPWHISRFFPMHKMRDREITPISILEKAEKIGLEVGLKYVYRGNI
jgi:pyruvate formate lyase activating enzyme